MVSHKRPLVLLLTLACCGGDDDHAPDGTPPDAADTVVDTAPPDTTSDTATDTSSDTATAPPPDTTDTTTPPPTSFALGVEYTEHGLGPVYGQAGVRWTKTHLEEFAWGAIEPAPPDGDTHTYDWTCPDDTVRTWQAAGVVNVMSYLVPDSLWGSSKVETILGKQVPTDLLPKPELMDDYAAWVRALVERYDHDGVDDMDGLLAPIRHWVVGAEWTGFWPTGDADDYLTLLTVTRRAILEADPLAQVGLIPFMLVDVFEGNTPSDAEIARRLADPPPSWRKSTAGMLRLLDHPELFDFLDVHSLGDYTEVPPTLAWFRAQMAARGYERPIWFDDAFPIGYLAHLHILGQGLPAWHPVTEAQYQAVYDLLVAVAKLAEPAYTPAMRWIRAEVAAGLVKKVIVAAGEGAAGIQIGNTEDWMTDEGPALRHTTMNVIGAAAMMGLVDVTHPDGYDPCARRVAGAPRPGWYNLGRLATVLADATAVTRIADLPAGVWAYRIARPAGELVIAWHEDDVLQLPGESETPVSVAIPLTSKDRAHVTPASTDIDAPVPPAVEHPVVDGAVTLALTSLPMFIEP